MIGKLEQRDFDKWLSLEEATAKDSAIRSNAAFANAMAKAARSGRENVRPGTFVDLTPPTAAKRLRGILPMSACGSPAAMCTEANTGAPIGAG